MDQDVIIAGMGGQGVLLIGQLLAHAAMVVGKNVVWLPSYGPETRGGTAQCTIITSDEQIGSPVIASPMALVALNQPLLDKLGPCVQREGLIVYNTSLAEEPTYRSDCKLIGIPATEAAEALGSVKAANMVMLGAYIELRQTVPLASVKNLLSEVLPEKYHKFLPLNQAALDKGAELMAGELAAV